MKKLVLILLFNVTQAFAQSQSVPLLDIRSLTETLNSVSEDQKLLNLRLFLKSSGDNWEKVRDCGGAISLSNKGWFDKQRLSDLNRTPRNAAEARALALARESLNASMRGDVVRYNQILREIAKLDQGLNSCGLDYSTIDSNVLSLLLQARVQVGSELQKAFFGKWLASRAAIFSNLIICQREFLEKNDPSLDCYISVLPKSSSPREVEHALSLVKEVAILTLLIERNQNPACIRFLDLTSQQSEHYDMGLLWSPLYDRNKDESFNSNNFTCRAGMQ